MGSQMPCTSGPRGKVYVDRLANPDTIPLTCTLFSCLLKALKSVRKDHDEQDLVRIFKLLRRCL